MKKTFSYPFVGYINNKLSPLCYNPHQPFLSPLLGNCGGAGSLLTVFHIGYLVLVIFLIMS